MTWLKGFVDVNTSTVDDPLKLELERSHEEALWCCYTHCRADRDDSPSKEIPMDPSPGTSDHQVPGLTTASDEFLVKTAQNGGHSAYVELCRRCREWMFCVVQRITKNSHDTEDVLQDAWMRGFVHI